MTGAGSAAIPSGATRSVDGGGFAGMWLLARRLTSRPEVQFLAALLFVANGLIASRLAVGHVSFSVCLLVPLIIPCGLAILVVLLCLGRINLINASVAAFVSVALSARKLVAMADFMRQFPRDLYPLPGADELNYHTGLVPLMILLVAAITVARQCMARGRGVAEPS